jgi:hypothetical protein
MSKTSLELLAARVLKLPIPDKLRFAARVLEETNDIRMACAVMQRALDELHLSELLGQNEPRKSAGMRDDGPEERPVD